MKILIFGALDTDYPRNRILRIGLQRLGVCVELCKAPPWKASLPRYAALLAEYVACSGADALLVPEFRHKDVPLARALASLSGIPLIVDPLVSRYDTRVHDWGTSRLGSWSAGHSRRVDRSAVRFADLLLTDTPQHAEYFQRQYRVPEELCAVVPVGFDDSIFQPLPDPSDKPFRIAFFGSYLPLHGVDTIVETAWQLRQENVRFLLIGTGQTFEPVRQARENGLGLEVVDHLPPRDLVQRLRSVHLLLGVFGTTAKASRVVPNKVYQSLALQRALVTAETPAIRSFFRPGDDLCTVPAGNSDALARAILDLRDKPELRHRIAASGARVVHAQFNPERVAGEFLEAGRRVLGWKVGDRMRLETAGRSVERLLMVFLYAIPLTVAWTVAGVHIALGIAAGLALLHGILNRRWPLRHTPADSGWLAIAVASLLAALFATEAARGFGPLEKLLLIPLVHVAAAAFSKAPRARWGLRLLVWGIAATVLIATVEFLLVPHSAEERLRGTTHYMTFAGLILLALPLAATASFMARGRLRLLYLACVTTLVLGLLLTFTRSAWLGTVVAFSVILLRGRPRFFLLLPPALLIIGLLLPHSYRERARSSFDPSHPTNLDRQRMWRAGIQIWRDHPWTGVGLGDLKPVYRDYAPLDAGRIHGHLHSNAVQILASMGTLGILAFVWLMLGVGRLVWVSGARAPDPESRALALGAWGAFWGFHTMGLFEWNFGDVEITIALYFMLGALWGIVAGRAAVATEPERGAVEHVSESITVRDPG